MVILAQREYFDIRVDCGGVEEGSDADGDNDQVQQPVFEQRDAGRCRDGVKLDAAAIRRTQG